MANTRYPTGFKLDAIKLVQRHGSIPRVCGSIGVQEATLRRWIKQYQAGELKAEPMREPQRRVDTSLRPYITARKHRNWGQDERY